MISIIICTLNEEDHLPALLQCIYDQTCQDYEVLHIDGGSVDNTIEIARSNLKRFKNLIIRRTKKGISHQRNLGAELATFSRILFLDADVLIPKDFLQNSLLELKSRKLEIAGTRIYSIERQFYYRSIYFLYSFAYLPVIRLINPVLHGCAIFSTKTLHIKIGGFREGIVFEDYLYAKMATKFTTNKILRSTSVFTSARRFYPGNKKQVIELVRGGLISFYKVGLPVHFFSNYEKQTGCHKKYDKI